MPHNRSGNEHHHAGTSKQSSHFSHPFEETESVFLDAVRHPLRITLLATAHTVPRSGSTTLPHHHFAAGTTAGVAVGFAAAAADKLQDIGTGDLAKLLLGFNVGVEAAQAAIILATAGVLWVLARARLETTTLRRVLGLLIAIAGTAIMATRIWSLTKGA